MKPLPPVVLAFSLILLQASAAWALPNQRPDDTWMVDGTDVRSVVYGGGDVYVGGRFERVTKGAPGTAGDSFRAVNLVAMGARSGAPRWGARIGRTRGVAAVWGLGLSPNGARLYVCGQFNRVNGARRRNLVALDADTGRLIRKFRPRSGVCWSVAATSRAVFAGQDTAITAYGAVRGGTRWRTRTDDRVLSVIARRTTLFVGGAFDSIGGTQRRVVARLAPGTGAVDRGWILGNGARIGANAFAHELFLARGALYMAGGGSDFAARFAPGDGSLVWKTDTSGSTQTIEPYGRGNVVIGGHFLWVADADTRQCGSNNDPVTTCTRRVRLAALDASTGDVHPSWEPQLTGAYNGARGLAVDDAGRLHLGGQFLRVDGVVQHHYGRLGA